MNQEIRVQGIRFLILILVLILVEIVLVELVFVLIEQQLCQ